MHGCLTRISPRGEQVIENIIGIINSYIGRKTLEEKATWLISL